jgi:hypothetical protein
VAAATSESKLHAVLLGYFPMFIATLSLLTSIYNGYLNSRFLDIVQLNVGRTEYMRTCKEVIEAYFDVKVKVGTLHTLGDRAAGTSIEQLEVTKAVAKFAALGTYLANLRDETIRVRYTELSWEVEKLASEARRMSAADLAKRLEATDIKFNAMNDDCVKSAKAMPM